MEAEQAQAKRIDEAQNATNGGTRTEPRSRSNTTLLIGFVVSHFGVGGGSPNGTISASWSTAQMFTTA